jgi:hypothetical protein
MADFLYSPDFKYNVKPSYDVAVTDHENRSEQRRLLNTTKLREYSLKFTNRTNTERDAVDTFFDAKKGALTAFTIDVDGEEVTVRFVKDSFWWSKVAYQVYNYGFQVKEVVS